MCTDMIPFSSNRREVPMMEDLCAGLFGFSVAFCTIGEGTVYAPGPGGVVVKGMHNAI